MPALTVDTQLAASRPQPAPPAAEATTNASAPMPQQPGPSQDAPDSQVPNNPPRNSSPVPPTYSPITPPPQPAQFPPPRPQYTYASHPEQQTAIAPPPPEPIDFDSNPDVLALKNAIAILQMQRKKAAADMVTLNRAKEAALQDPSAFIQDLTSGRVGVEGDRLFVGGVSGGDDSSSDDSDDDDEKDSQGDKQMADAAPASGDTGVSSSQLKHNAEQTTQAGPSENPESLPRDSTTASGSTDLGIDVPSNSIAGAPQSSSSFATGSTKPKIQPWTTLPKPQNVVRCPPINWGQYAIVGDSLDKLHREQQTRPTLGQPAVLTPDGRYDFGTSTDGAGGSGHSGSEPYLGIAAPYNPLRDHITEKPTTSPKGKR